MGRLANAASELCNTADQRFRPRIVHKFTKIIRTAAFRRPHEQDVLRTALALALLACASLVLISPASAQSIYGSIFGTVTDKSGAAVPDATVTVTDEAKGTVVTVTSNASGDYSVAHLIPDVYDLKVEAKGFKSFETKGIQVQADTAPRIDPTMDVGGSTETVQVNARPATDLKTDRADVATIFDQQQISSLPVGDQNFTNLQLLLPGAQKLGWSHAADENPQASQQIQVDGQAFGGTAFELDGTDNQDPILGIIVINPSMDAVAETKITTQNFDAELGKAVSAVVTAQTKFGHQQLPRHAPTTSAPATPTWPTTRSRRAPAM